MAATVRKLLILLHRWLGLGFCLLFLMWFLSGAVLAYWDYPTVTDRARHTHAEPIDASRIHFTADQAYASLKLDGPPASTLLLMFDGRPAFRFDDALVYADTGEPRREFPMDLTRRIAAAWAKQPASAATLEVMNRIDQWTVSGEFAGLRPLDKYSWPNGDQVYVSEVTGDVAQYTTRASRLGAYFGAIPHWLYFTPLRANGRLWSRIVIWSSGIGAVAAALGLIVGVWIVLPSKRIPYKGQKRLHAMLGLIFGLFACAWAFSGMLSMEPFSFSAGPRRIGAKIDRALRQGGRKSWEQVLAEARNGAKLVDFNSLAGDPAAILEAVRHAVEPDKIAETRQIAEYEAYYLDRRGEHPLPALFIRLNDDRGSMFYIDPKTASIVEAYDSASRVNRWLYHGFHSLDLPWLYGHRPAWDIAIVTLLTGGAWLSVTSVIIAWRLLRRALA